MSRKPVKFGWKAINLVKFWRGAPRLRLMTRYWFLSQVGFAATAYLHYIDSHVAFRIIPSLIGSTFLVMLLAGILSDFNLKRELDEIRDQIRSRRAKYDEALEAGNDWLVEIHRTEHDRLVGEHQKIRDKLLGRVNDDAAA